MTTANHWRSLLISPRSGTGRYPFVIGPGARTPQARPGRPDASDTRLALRPPSDLGKTESHGGSKVASGRDDG